MMVMVRDREYSELLQELKCKKVAIWTCNTCARLSDGVGGSEAAIRLGNKLRDDGVDVVWIGSTSASCVEKKVIEASKEMEGNPDTVVVLTCNIGCVLAAKIFDMPAINPISTLGQGYIGEHREICIVDENNDVLDMENICVKRGCLRGPFI